ncbi:methyltransferase-like protein 9, partial [Escherichia coli]|nr:methyltransferase-like protein 9 [Escherichia coli]
EEQQVELTYIHGLNTFKTVEVDNRELVQNCAYVDLELINQPLEKDTVSKFYDLVVCLNVLDQCESPLRVINALKQATQIG